MGTRADFYVGKGENAEWLGSTAWDGYPDGIPSDLLTASTAEDFEAALEAHFATRDDLTRPDMGWPWPWDTSHTTDFAYAFDGDRVWISQFGHTWLDATGYEGLAQRHEDETEDEWEARNEAYFDAAKMPDNAFPNMADRKNIQFGGKRSGLIVFGG